MNQKEKLLIVDLTVGPLQTNCFVIADTVSGEAMVVDPGDEPDRIMDVVHENSLKVKYVVCTHAHFDHLGAVSDIKAETGARVVLHRDELGIYASARDLAVLWGFDLDQLPPPDMLVGEGDKIDIGGSHFEIFHSPGHSPGGICLYGESIVVTGDTLFAGSVGRTDFPGGDIDKLKESFRRLMSLPEQTRVLPGHGPETSIGHEKRENMFSEEFLV